VRKRKRQNHGKRWIAVPNGRTFEVAVNNSRQEEKRWVDEDKAREETGEEGPTSPQHETLGEVDDGDVEDTDEDTDWWGKLEERVGRTGEDSDEKVVRYKYLCWTF
jgi:hypothetical protein